MELQVKALPKPKRRKKVLQLTAIFFILIFAFIFIYNYLLTSAGDAKYQPVGKMVDIGEYQLHMYAVGEKTNLPTILLESGSGTPSSVSDWRYIQPELAKLTRVITYDRAGYGWSDSAENDRTSEQIVVDLHKMLEVSGEMGPFILVGHSFGGFNMQLFAQRYPDEAAGLVLLDSSLIGKSPEVSNSGLMLQESLRIMGIMRVMGDLGMLPVPDAVLSDNRSKEFLYRNFYNQDQRNELTLMASADEKQLQQVQKDRLGNLPVLILSSRAEEAEHKDWQKAQDALLKLSTDSSRKIVENSSHYIHHDQPKVVINSILGVMEKAR